VSLHLGGEKIGNLLGGNILALRSILKPTNDKIGSIDAQRTCLVKSLLRTHVAWCHSPAILVPNIEKGPVDLYS
jgi:hypothetical protein